MQMIHLAFGRLYFNVILDMDDAQATVTYATVPYSSVFADILLDL